MTSNASLRAGFLTALVAAILIPAATASAEPTPEDAYRLGKEAYHYGFPLLEFNRTRTDDLAKVAPVNRLANARDLARAGADNVVAPNADTLYTIAQFDLAKPLVLRVPKMGSRYWTFQFVEPWTNVVGYIGKREFGGKGGTWVLQWKDKPAGALPKGARRFTSPSRRLWVIGRTLVKGKSDLSAARRVMAGFRTGSLADLAAGKELARPIGRIPFRPKGSSPTGIRFITTLNREMATDPPPARDKAILDRLASAEVGIGKDPSRLSAGVRAELVRGVNDAAKALPGEARLPVLQEAMKNGGWYIPARDIGNFGTRYDFRARVALVGLGANTPIESVYPVALTSPDKKMFNGANRYQMVFRKGQLPPTKAFWSVTMYDTNGYLVKNSANIYAVGDSHPPLRKRRDGSVVVAIQKDKPAGRDVNWLPAPSGGFRLTMRLYMPRASILSGAWKPPGVVKVG